MTNRGRDGERRVAFEVLSSIGGLAALALGTLYLGGIAVKSTELQGADLPVADALKLFPLEHILRTGLTLVVPAVLTLGVFGLLLFVMWRYERWLVRLAVRFREQEAEFQPEDERQAWADALADAERRTAWEPIGIQLKAARAAASEGDDKERRRRLAGFSWALSAWNFLGFVLLLVVLPTFCLFLAPEFAIPTGAVLLGTILYLAWHPRPVEQELAILYTILLVAFVAGTLAFPKPLAKAYVVTGGDEKVSGGLVLATDASWYVAVGSGVIRAIPSEDIECAEMVGQPHRVRVIDQLGSKTEPTPGSSSKAPALDCD